MAGLEPWATPPANAGCTTKVLWKRTPHPDPILATFGAFASAGAGTLCTRSTQCAKRGQPPMPEGTIPARRHPLSAFPLPVPVPGVLAPGPGGLLLPAGHAGQWVRRDLGDLQVAGRGHRPAGGLLLRALGAEVGRQRQGILRVRGPEATRRLERVAEASSSRRAPPRSEAPARIWRIHGRRDQGQRETQNGGRERDGAGRGPSVPDTSRARARRVHHPPRGAWRADRSGLEARALAQTPPAPAPPGGGSPTMSAADALATKAPPSASDWPKVVKPAGTRSASTSPSWTPGTATASRRTRRSASRRPPAPSRRSASPRS